MRKKIWIIVIFVIVLCFAGCTPVYYENTTPSVSQSTVDKENAIVDYYNNYARALFDKIKKISENYNYYQNSNDLSAKDRVKGLMDETISLIDDLDNNISQISETITDDEIMSIHKLFKDYSVSFRSVVLLTIALLQNNDLSVSADINDRIYEMNNAYQNIKDSLNKLTEKYGLVHVK